MLFFMKLISIANRTRSIVGLLRKMRKNLGKLQITSTGEYLSSKLDWVAAVLEMLKVKFCRTILSKVWLSHDVT